VLLRVEVHGAGRAARGYSAAGLLCHRARRAQCDVARQCIIAVCEALQSASMRVAQRYTCSTSSINTQETTPAATQKDVEEKGPVVSEIGTARPPPIGEFEREALRDEEAH
jgi:hypothetical protein